MTNRAQRHLVNIILSLLCVACSTSLCAQDEYVRAERLFNEAKFDSAAQLYLDLFNAESPKNPSTYLALSRSLYEVKNFDRLGLVAEKYRIDSEDPLGYIDQYWALLSRGKGKKADNLWKEITAYTRASSEVNCSRLMQRLIRYGAFSQAKTIFSQFAPATHSAHQNLVEQYLELYFLEDSMDKALALSLEYLKERPLQVEDFERFFDRQKSKEDFYNLFKQKLFTYTSQHPEVSFTLHLLIWLEQVHGNFGEAARFGLMLARRSADFIPNLLDLAQDAFNNDALVQCLELCDFVLTSEYINSYGGKAAQLKLTTQKRLLDQGEEQAVDLNYLESALLVLGNNREADPSIQTEALLEYCSIQIKYRQDIAYAVNFLDSLIQSNTFARKNLNRIKLLYGEALTMQGKPWKALIVYTQVDHDDGDGILSEEARFRKAQLSYYEGEFEWAQAQLNILKGATSELISNNAIQLSVFITDNLGLDSNTDAMVGYAAIELLVAQRRYSEVITALNTWEQVYDEHVLMDNALVMRAEIYEKQQNLEAAIRTYNRVLDRFESSILCDNVHWSLAELYRKQEEHELVKKHCLAILTDYPDSRLANSARELYRSYP
ncbi:MAG: hypothetical protein VXX18_07120 [Bacteroidota bacterium]|nr:hypothetical protein [Bacteroidota bacterium]